MRNKYSLVCDIFYLIPFRKKIKIMKNKLVRFAYLKFFLDIKSLGSYFEIK